MNPQLTQTKPDTPMKLKLRTYKNFFAGLLTIFFVLPLSSCASLFSVGPNYQPPLESSPSTYKADELGHWSVGKLLDKAPSIAWWQIFKDEQLNSLEEKVGSQNQKIKAAYARVAQARALARLDRSFLMPTVNTDGFWFRARTAKNQLPGPGGVQFDQMGTPVDLSYEVDLWGRVRRSFEGARAEAQASYADLFAMQLTQESDLAEDYFTLRALDEQIGQMNSIVEINQSKVELEKQNYAAGLASQMETNDRKARLEIMKTQLAQLLAQREKLENAIAVLAGENPSQFKLASLQVGAWHVEPPSIPAGLPSELLERRPDVSAAERVLASSNAQIGVAKAAFFPVVTLTGSGGYISSSVDSLFNWSDRAWSIGPSVSLPIFNGGRIMANLAHARSSYQEALAKYRDQVLLAFCEVENAFVASQRLNEQFASTDQAAQAQEANSNLSKIRFEAGLGDHFELDDSTEVALSLRQQAWEIAGQRMVATVEIIKSLGGGWDAHSAFGSSRDKGKTIVISEVRDPSTGKILLKNYKPQ